MPAGPIKVPPAPGHLRDKVAAAWEAFWSIKPLAARVGEADHLPLMRLFQLYEIYNQAIDRFMADPYVEGYRGTLVVHPAWQVANSAMRQILPLEKQFGITPKARSELGIVIDVPANPTGDEGAMDFTDEGE